MQSVIMICRHERKFDGFACFGYMIHGSTLHLYMYSISPLTLIIIRESGSIVIAPVSIHTIAEVLGSEDQL